MITRIDPETGLTYELEEEEWPQVLALRARREEVRRLRHRGLPVRAIAQILNITERTVSRYLKGG